MKNRKSRKSSASPLPKGFQSLWNDPAPRSSSARRVCSEPNLPAAKPVVLVAQAQVQPLAPSCPRVGDKGQVAYPPFLMAFDSHSEGRVPVEARAHKAPPDKPRCR